jgi:2-polyprenyl-6-methoxyphenol hydroxylase-like FAD-dependent oxidoreductase
VVLIGDAAHVCPPTLAQGAAMALEDAIVLAEMLLLRHDRLDGQLLADFTDRRYHRVKAIVDGSLQVCRWLLEHDTTADVPGMFTRIASMVSEPA